jgi:hypothetical protein
MAAIASPAVVYLDGPKSLAELQVTNPTHYARAERIIAAATELCKPGPLEARYVGFEAKEISCADMLLKTSNPPKKQLKFRLDDTLYFALVTVGEGGGKLMPAGR